MSVSAVDFADPLAAAQWLANRGMHVFPVDHPDLERCAGMMTSGHDPATCTDRGKHPAVRWSTAATIDLREVAAMFTGSPRNIGIACKPSGLLVADEDTPGGFARFAADLGQVVPATFGVRTGRGQHIYLADPKRTLGNSAGPLKAYGVDVRGGGQGFGGYVVGPGSRHRSGVLYEPPDPGAPVLPVPGWLAAALAPSQPRGEIKSTRTYVDKPRGLDAVSQVIRGLRVDAGGQRHEMLVRYAASLRARDMPMAEAIELFRRAWERCEQPPVCTSSLTWPEAKGKLEDCYRRYTPNAVRPDLAGYVPPPKRQAAVPG